MRCDPLQRTSLPEEPAPVSGRQVMGQRLPTAAAAPAQHLPRLPSPRPPWLRIGHAWPRPRHSSSHAGPQHDGPAPASSPAATAGPARLRSSWSAGAELSGPPWSQRDAERICRATSQSLSNEWICRRVNRLLILVRIVFYGHILFLRSHFVFKNLLNPAKLFL